MDFTFEEQELMAIYNPGTRLGLIQALNEMRTYLDEDEQELRTLTVGFCPLLIIPSIMP